MTTTDTTDVAAQATPPHDPRTHRPHPEPPAAHALADLTSREFKHVLTMFPHQATALKRQRKEVIAARNRASTAARAIITQWRQAHGKVFASDDRLQCAATGNPMPGVTCHCPACTAGHAAAHRSHWPAYYVSSRQVSYECWLHDQPEWFLNALPSSSSIAVRRVQRGKKAGGE